MTSSTPALDRLSPSLGDALIAASLAAGPDPFSVGEPRVGAVAWIYAPGEYEAGALARVVSEGHAVNRHVDYALNFAAPRGAGRFHGVVRTHVDTLELGSTGEVSVVVDGATIEAGATTTVRELAVGSVIDIRVFAPAGTPAAIFADATTLASIEWHAALGDEQSSPARARAGGATPPHLDGEPEQTIHLSDAGGGVFVAPAPVLGVVQLRGVEGSPVLSVGESLDEALADPAFGESDTSLVADGEGAFESRHKLGLRYVRVAGATVDSVSVRASVRPASRRGAFVTSDPELTRIWSSSAYTLRLCLQTFLVDGIKRDRMPWIGDHALGILTNAFAFADADIIRDTLTALGRPRHGYINGIADYSLWWVISHGLYQRYFDDLEYLVREADGIHSFLDDLARHATDGGVFRPADLPDAFEQSGPGGLFLDWGVQLHRDRDATAIQMLWYWALRSGAAVLTKAAHAGADHWRRKADELADTLRDRAWSASGGHWREYLDSDGAPTAYPNFLATLAGLTAPVDSPQHAPATTMVDAIASAATGTPFMRAFALLSLGALGDGDHAVSEIRRLWGRMLDAGATTFWEEFGETGASPYEMYRRPFGKSLCHAWSAGPLAVLPELVLGIAPRTDGWSEFHVSPRLGELEWAGCVVPTPHGDIVVLADRDETTVDVPAGTTALIAGTAYEGPRTVTVRL